jgi:AbrB family looped-hinge helix DNA binding protein
MHDYRAKLGEDGRLVIPAACRRELHLVPGEELLIRVENDEMHLRSLKYSLKKAQEVVRSHAKKQNLVEKLKKMRQEDNGK